MNKLRLVLIAIALVIAAVLFFSDRGKERAAAPSPQRMSPSAARNTDSSAILLSTITTALNNLPDESVLELAPPKPILDDAKSADGKEVLAICDVTPEVPDGPYNYLKVPKGNANFRRLGVRAGDIVRYFVAADQESSDFGIQQRTFFELPVRRLDVNNPQNALIVEGGLNGPVPLPERIEIWRFSDRRMNEIRQRLNRYIKRGEPALGWEPSPDEGALTQMVDRLNQWLRNRQKAGSDWQVDSHLAELPTDISEAELLKPYLSADMLGGGAFESFEIRELQQAIWLRDISDWAKGEVWDDDGVASALFDWTVRNIQLDGPKVPESIHRPWQALMFGHGSAEHRAWIFAELCRQQQLDVVMLYFGEQPSEQRPWLAALLSDGKLYLYDLRLGLPIPAADPTKAATLAEVIADPELLRKLDVGEEFQYPITAEALAKIDVKLVASPLQLTQRAELLQQTMEGDDFVVLAAENQRIADALPKDSGISSVQLWTYPWEMMATELSLPQGKRLNAGQRFLVFAQRPRLWKARTLHFQGLKQVPIDQRNDPLAQAKDGHLEAMELYRNKRVRVPDSALERLEPAKQLIYRRAKYDASYWVGLLSYERGMYEVAMQWLKDRTLKVLPDGPWTAGANYNLARSHEALEQYAEAIELLEADSSPQRHGNLLRAAQLRAKQEASPVEEDVEAEK